MLPVQWITRGHSTDTRPLQGLSHQLTFRWSRRYCDNSSQQHPKVIHQVSAPHSEFCFVFGWWNFVYRCTAGTIMKPVNNDSSWYFYNGQLAKHWNALCSHFYGTCICLLWCNTLQLMWVLCAFTEEGLVLGIVIVANLPSSDLALFLYFHFTFLVSQVQNFYSCFKVGLFQLK